MLIAEAGVSFPFEKKKEKRLHFSHFVDVNTCKMWLIIEKPFLRPAHFSLEVEETLLWASRLMSGVTATGVYSFMKLLNVGSRSLIELERLDGAAGAAVRVCVAACWVSQTLSSWNISVLGRSKLITLIPLFHYFYFFKHILRIFFKNMFLLTNVPFMSVCQRTFLWRSFLLRFIIMSEWRNILQYNKTESALVKMLDTIKTIIIIINEHLKKSAENK